MAKNKIQDLRDHLFMSLEELSDDEKMSDPIAREKAITIAQAKSAIAKEINTTAALEMKFLQEFGTGQQSTFMGELAAPALPKSKDN